MLPLDLVTMSRKTLLVIFTCLVTSFSNEIQTPEWGESKTEGKGEQFERIIHIFVYNIVIAFYDLLP